MKDHDRRIVGLGAWDGSPAEARPIRWSEVGPAAVPRQTLVSVEVSDGESASRGIASLTHYASPNAATLVNRVDSFLAGWLGAPVKGIPLESADGANPYDFTERPLHAAVELAVLDALGHETRLPVAAFLGGTRRSRIDAYASLPSFASPEAAVDCASEAVESGFRAVKFHASGISEADVETIAVARRTFGEAVKLMWDASCAYDLYSALAVGRALVEANFLWFEAPLADSSSEALRTLATSVSVPLVPDGLVQRAAADWARDVRDGIWGALRLDVTRTAGVASAQRLVRLSETFGLPCEIQSFGFPLSQYSNLQLMLATDACRFFEAPFPSEDFEDGIATMPKLVDGLVLAPDRPGLGHDVDFERVAGECRPLANVAL